MARNPHLRKLPRSPVAILGAVVSAIVVSVGAAGAAAGSDPTPGAAQSPIDFREDDITFVDRLPVLEFSYPRRTDVTLVNTGSPDEETTIRADVSAGAAFVTVGGVRYDLLQFHWHTPSEHEIEGERTPLEMHFVHRAADGSLLVVAVFIEEGSKNRKLKRIFRALPEHAGDIVQVSRVRLSDALPREDDSFRYDGSLTTPPFTEGVRWIVLADPIRMSERQIDAFRDLFEEGNSRDVQPLNGRVVLSDAEDAFEDEEDTFEDD
jgi:carbonic anhydrase